LFLEILAATLDLPLYVATQDETTALGAAICAAVGAGCYDSFETAVNIMGSRIEVIEPNKEWKKEYVSYYQRWKQNFEKMRGI
jgi:autoinducer 2 (AI-2) kinase